jgi:hypothetical protein
MRILGLCVLGICTLKQFGQIFSKVPQRLQPFRRGFNYLLFGLKNLPACDLGQHANDFPDGPAGRAEHLQALRPWNQERDAVIAHHADTLGKSVKRFQFESGEVDLLELPGGIGHWEIGN